MDRKQKLYLIVGGALVLVMFIVTALVMSAQKRNTPESEPEETPIVTITPTIEPTATPTSTPGNAVLPDVTLPGEMDAPTPTSTATAAPTSTPTATPKPTSIPAPSLPGSSGTTKPTAAPKPTAIAVEPTTFDFSLPSRANARAPVTITVSNGANAQSVAWATTKSGLLGIQTEVSIIDATGTLTNTGGALTFYVANTYTVTATVKTKDGKTQKVSRSIVIKETDTFNFSIPRTAYTDTVVQVQTLNGSEAAAWEVMKDGAATEQSAAFAGTLDKTGGMITFRSEGKYTLTGTSAAGGKVSAEITVKARS
jgi:cytoskeletal protein RodZ